MLQSLRIYSFGVSLLKMKLFIFLIIITMNAVLSRVYVNDKDTAREILDDLEALLPKVNKFLANVNKGLSDLKPIDFRLKDRPRIKLLQDDIGAKAGKPNITTCNEQLNQYVRSVEGGFQKLVKTKLSEQKVKLSQIVSTLNTMKTQLQVCIDKGTGCTIVDKYIGDVFDYGTFVKDHTDELMSPQIVQKYSGMYVNAALMEKDEEKVINPVKKCLAGIK